MSLTANFFLSYLLFLLATIQGSHAVEYIVINNATSTPGGARFDKELGVEFTKETLNSVSNFIWMLLQENDHADRKILEKVTFFVQEMDGLAYATNDEIHVSARHFEVYEGDLKTDLAALLDHEATHIWQWNGEGKTPIGLVEGIADFVMFTAGYGVGAKPGEGDRWDQGYGVTALFLDYLNSLSIDFVAQLNKKMRHTYSEEYFVDLLGKPVDQLWKEYQDKYNS